MFMSVSAVYSEVKLSEKALTCKFMPVSTSKSSSVVISSLVPKRDWHLSAKKKMHLKMPSA